MRKKVFFKITGSLFAIIAALHLLRAVFVWPIEVSGVPVPMWVSWLAAFAVGTLSYYSFQFSK